VPALWVKIPPTVKLFCKVIVVAAALRTRLPPKVTPLVFTLPVPVKYKENRPGQVNLEAGRRRPLPVPAPFEIVKERPLAPANATLPEPLFIPEALRLPAVTVAVKVTVIAVLPLIELLSKMASSLVPGVVVVVLPPDVVLHAPVAFQLPDVGAPTVPPTPIQNFCAIL
jgi:hypothetical protein